MAATTEMSHDQEGNQMPQDAGPKVSLGRLEWGVIISLLVSAATTVFSAGVLYGDLRDVERRVEVIEDKAGVVAETMRDNGERLARIETNVELLVDRYKTDRTNGR